MEWRASRDAGLPIDTPVNFSSVSINTANPDHSFCPAGKLTSPNFRDVSYWYSCVRIPVIFIIHLPNSTLRL